MIFTKRSSMDIAILIPPKDFRDETVANAIGLMHKWSLNPLIASSTFEECVGYHGAVFKPNILVREITTESFDAIFIPDGSGIDAYKLYDSRQVLDIIKHFNERSKPIACVNNSIKILARANVITNVKIASVADVETARLIRLFRGIMTENEIETEGNILTLGNNNKTDDLVDAVLDKLKIR